MNSLTEEQKRRIEENRRKALEKRASKTAATAVAVNRNVTNLYANNPVSQAQNVSKNNSRFITGASSSFPATSQPRVSSSFLATSQSDARSSFSSTSQPSASSNIKYGNSPAKLFGTPNANGSYANKNSFLSNTQTNGAQSSSKVQVKDFYSNKQQLKGTFVLITRKSFFVDVGYHVKAIEVFKTIPSRTYDAKTKKWSFDIKDHATLATKLRELQSEILFSPLPSHVIKLFSSASEAREVQQHDLSKLDPVILDALMPFQKVGVNFGIQCDGKVLIADDMGLGKTIQAIAIANYYKQDWPLLIITPSSVRYAWREAFWTWLPSQAHEVSIINTAKDHITNDKIVILSYDILTRRKDDLLRRGFRSVIADESHFLKNMKSARTKAFQLVMKRMKRIIMLSGTPALSRPIELFPQISALKPSVFLNFMDFGVRYCNGRKQPWGWDFSGFSNMEELQLILEETVMIRRLKSEVITQLPAKQRQMIVLDPSLLKGNHKVLQSMSKKMATKSLKGMERRGVLLQYFHETGAVKLTAICQYIKDLLEADKKFICFAHHILVLDGICKAVEDFKVDFIRIDGSTTSEQRKILCDKFQLKDTCKVAVLSISAANAGITLTAAGLVVFAELYWNPGILTQAEDRAHRIGQEDSVIVQYLVAQGTADDEIWPLVQRKLNILNKAGLSKDNFSDADTIQAESFNQPDIRNFWSELDSELDVEFTLEDEEVSPNKRPKLA